MKRKRMLFVYNPMAGKELIRNKLSDIIRIFSDGGFLVTIISTNQDGDAIHFIREHGASYEYVVCSGGDGTMNEVANALMQLEDRPICGYIPSGTVNDFATSLRIPKIMKKAAELITKGTVFQCDMGKFNEKYFTYVAAFGAFTEVSYQTSQDLKNMFGKVAYMMEAFKHIGDIAPHHMTIDYDGKRIEGNYILGIFSNTISVGGFPAFEKKHVKMDDGLFEVLMIRELKNPLELQETINGLISKNLDSPEFTILRAKSIYIVSDDDIAWTLDGEDGGSGKIAQLTNCQQALPIICSLSARNHVSILPKLMEKKE